MPRADSVSGFGYQPKGPLGLTTAGTALALARSSASWTARHGSDCAYRISAESDVSSGTAACVLVGGMTLAVPGATGFVAPAQRTVIGSRSGRPSIVPIAEPWVRARGVH